MIFFTIARGAPQGVGQELRDKYPIYPRSCPQEGEVGHTIDRCIRPDKASFIIGQVNYILLFRIRTPL